MQKEIYHPSNQDLLLTADGELPARQAARIRAHLVACWDCRARMAKIESTIADFVRAKNQIDGPPLPSIDGPRALLKGRLAQLASERKVRSRPWFFHFASATRVAASICVAVLIAAVAGRVLLQRPLEREPNSIVTPFERGAVPDGRLTPGATRKVTISEICSMPHEKVVGEVSMSLRQEVLHEYGIANALPGGYEIDYLIAPGLGGMEDIHNLWPEPYTSQTWNAYVKDDLEERLHQLVCGGELDLSTAQHDIATDWIAAYKKYFHTDRPLSLHSHLDEPPLPGFAGINPETRQAE
jgi:hypothetical protein